MTLTTTMRTSSSEFGAEALAPPTSETEVESCKAVSSSKGCLSSLLSEIRKTFTAPKSPFDRWVENDSTIISEIGGVAHKEPGPRMVEEYQMSIDTLGKGEFGKVLDIWNSQTYKLAAVKMISKCDIESEGSLIAVNREIGVLKNHSKHRNIIGFRKVLHTSKNIYIITERATNNLHELIKSDAVAAQPDLIQQVMFGVLSGLNYLHERGVSHCDIYPRSILIRSGDGECIQANHVRLCGFGKALTSENHADNAATLLHKASPFPASIYRAPEASRDELFDSRCADVWSVGVSFLESTHGFPDGFRDAAYDSNTNEVEKILAPIKAIVERSEGKRRAHDLLFKLLVCDATQRLTAAQAMHHCWFKYAYAY